MTSTQHLEMEIDLLEKKKKATESDLRYKARQYNGNMPCDPGMEDNDVAFLMLMSIERDRDLLDVQIAEKRLELYNIQAGQVPAVASISEEPSGQEHSAESKPSSPPATMKVERGWYYVLQTNGSGQFLAFANAKGSCSLRRFDASDGTALPREANRHGDYRVSFATEIKAARPLTVSHQPNLERDCKKRLPSTVLSELQKQVESVTA
ncbi:MAG: hypothetical protein IT167_29555 [Bryobacterales bacterium]|nr:hypothetical protein [Bryobacterales bacterium]